MDWQTYLVILCSLSFTRLFYFVMNKEHRNQDCDSSELRQRWCKYGKATNPNRIPFRLFVKEAVDIRFLGACFLNNPEWKPALIQPKNAWILVWEVQRQIRINT